MNAILADLRQPTCTESLSPAMQGYLRERVRAATGAHTPQRWDIKLYQCLGDARSAEAMCEDLLDFVSDDAQGITGIVAVFECSQCNTEAPFAEVLQRHMDLIRGANPLVSTAGGNAALDDDEVRMQVDGRDFTLLCMHAQAQRLSRVSPCPVLVFSAR